MKVEKFFRDGGLKILAVAQLNPCECGIIFYLLNCSVSGLDEIVTTDSELASLMGYSEKDLRDAVVSLFEKQLLKVSRHAQATAQQTNPSLRLGLEYNIHKWQIKTMQKQDLTSSDALVFPFRRRGNVNLQMVEGDQNKYTPLYTNREPWQLILEKFIKNRELDQHEMEEAEEAAKVLADTHPLDQVLYCLKHFGGRIPNLSLLASSWQHYLEILENEVQNIDIGEARKKHVELDEELKQKALAQLESAANAPLLNDEEKTVLNIIIKHRHPRRQLYWALQAKERYPNLAAFFQENMSLMLSVTSSGQVIKRPYGDTSS